MNIIEGKIVDKNMAREFLKNLEDVVNRTKTKVVLDHKIVIQASNKVSEKMKVEKYLPLLLEAGISPSIAKKMFEEAKYMLSTDYLEKKIERELGESPFEYKNVENNIYQKKYPLGVITHIAAGNASGLPAYTVIEGLLTGNINLLKLPGGDDGLSTPILKMLIDIEPILSEYIYVFDLPSLDVDAIKTLLHVSDAVTVWGSDFAIAGIRAIAPPGVRIIEWGHKISFAYITKKGTNDMALEGLAREICTSEQILCSSPQLVYFETETYDELENFGKHFFDILNKISKEYIQVVSDISIQSEITTARMLAEEEDIFGRKKSLLGEGFSVIIDKDQELLSSPMFRNIVIKKVSRKEFASLLLKQKNYLQTMGLACHYDEIEEISEIFFKCGGTRVKECKNMFHSIAGEPHDGRIALDYYVKNIVLEL